MFVNFILFLKNIFVVVRCTSLIYCFYFMKIDKFGGFLLNYSLIKKIAIKIFLNLLFFREVNIEYRVDKNYFCYK